ncbi:MAG TPA: sigma-70 family RNA polymerase sigma factor [Pyrinomonadaceae bacterium]
MRLVIKSDESRFDDSTAEPSEPPSEPLSGAGGPWGPFDGDGPSVVERFRALQSKLIFYFERRHCFDPEELADETLERVMRKLCEGTEVLDLTHYSYGVARNVFYEYLRKEKAKHKYSDEQRRRPEAAAGDDEEAETRERRLRCLEGCMARLKERERWLMFEYYKYKGQRKVLHKQKLAEHLNISREALTLRIFHLKRRLKTCIEDCLGND